MAKEKFENRLLTGPFNVTCKFDDGTSRQWQGRKEDVVQRIQSIVQSYMQQGYVLTLRQLHYQFVGHDPNYVNHDTAYKKLGKILDDCRYSGIIDWDAIEDRGRRPYIPYSVTGIPGALQDTVYTYRLDRQEGQENCVEVWTEKDALSGIMKRSTQKYHVKLVVNKGYTSSSAIYESYERFCNMISEGKRVVILYFGDHDPSGLDMIRDIRERLEMMFDNGEKMNGNYWQDSFEVIPIGLNMKQIKQYKCPPNPTKMTDTRADKYIAEFGKTCWEVDALSPNVLTDILESNIEYQIDIDTYNDVVEREQKERNELKAIIKKFE